MRAVVVAERDLAGRLEIAAPGGTAVAATDERHGGPPYWWHAEVASAAAGEHAVRFVAPGLRLCATLAAHPAPAPLAPAGYGAVWPVERRWSRELEDLYSAWIEKLFAAPLAEQPSWPALHDVLRDRARNFLHDHLGASEDDEGGRAPRLDPDCADLPYFLRAYFSFKLRLPFGYSGCTRGGRQGPPHCTRFYSSLTANRGKERDPIRAFGAFARVTLADATHSGAVRTPGNDESGDFYPVALSDRTLRPGTIFADPYGHILVIARRVAQTPEASGVLLAVDGQPDGTVARRRFWRGNFLFSDDPVHGGPGFKRFRPVVVEGRRARALGNSEIAASADWGDFSLEQYQLVVEGFYDRIEDILSPTPTAAARALRETVQALEEQVRARVLSVQNGVDFVSRGGGRIDMPEGPGIFETVGPWEDFATPSRDMRLLIAIDVVRAFAARVERRPERYAMPAGKSAAEVRAELEALLAKETAARRFAYARSDGTKQELSLADLLARAPGLEMAYNPNDCAEVRWAAPAGSAELSTCRRRAPPEQRRLMERYRTWFAERRRPPRE
ncbi:MAG: hypothetical protein HY744_00900 [Deltaproteobacteria bacterium]|nr:hypothetical protein [Deltaproteobacteria bacterium]